MAPSIRLTQSTLQVPGVGSTSGSQSSSTRNLTQSTLQIPGVGSTSSRSSSTRLLRPSSPARNIPGFVITPNDSRTALSRPTTPEANQSGPLANRVASPRPPAPNTKTTKKKGKVTAQAKAKPTAKGKARSSTSKRVRSASASTSGGSPRSKGTNYQNFEVPDDVDLSQDSDIEYIGSDEAPNYTQARIARVKVLLSYYFPPQGREYRCRWCKRTFLCGKQSYFNLWGHRDGAKGRPACKKRHLAIEGGAELPPTYEETQAAKKKKQADGTLTAYLGGSKFTVDLLNLILVIWIVRYALPWARFEDVILRAAFHLVNRAAVVRSATWAAKTFVELFADLHNKVIKTLRDNEGRFCLVHDVWTTKGNRYAFVGASAHYIDKDWEYKTVHLTLKMVGWRHFGVLLARPIGRFLIRHGLHKKMLAQTTDSGGNNGPMASELELMFSAAEDPVTWEASENHVRCYAHKLNLTVGHGLKALGQKAGHTKPTTQPGLSVPIPALEINDGEDEVEVDEAESDCDEEEEIMGDPDGVDEEDELENSDVIECDQDDVVAVALRKVDAVCGQIVSSAARRSDFKSRAARMGYKGGMLKRPCKTRWNSHYTSRKLACEAQEIINMMLAADRKACFFKGVTISASEWHAVELVNKVLKTFVDATARFEGNHPTGCIVLADYKRVITELQTHQDESIFPSLNKAIDVMIKWLTKYQAEALQCRALILATVLNPRFRVKFFQVHYPEYEESASSDIMEAMDGLLGQSESRDPTPTPDPSAGPCEVDTFDVFGTITGATDSNPTELDDYLRGRFPIVKDQDPLAWWKEYQHHFPQLSKLARDYLAVSATSCACERTFSAAADICTPSRGALLPKTMERLVGAQSWLKDGIEPDGKFASAFQAIQAFLDS